MNRDNYLKSLRHNVEKFEQQENLDPMYPRDNLMQGACRAFLGDFIFSSSCDVLQFYRDGQFVLFKVYMSKLNSTTQGLVNDYILRFASTIQVKGEL